MQFKYTSKLQIWKWFLDSKFIILDCKFESDFWIQSLLFWIVQFDSEHQYGTRVNNWGRKNGKKKYRKEFMRVWKEIPYILIVFGPKPIHNQCKS